MWKWSTEQKEQEKEDILYTTLGDPVIYFLIKPKRPIKINQIPFKVLKRVK